MEAEHRIEKIKKMLLEYAQDSFLRHALALEFIKLEHFREAEGLFVQLLQDNEDYIGSYYHLALLQSKQNTEKAIETIEKGIAIAKKLGDKHAQNELQMLYDELRDD